MSGYAIGRQNGWYSANDIRELEDMNKIPKGLGGDRYLCNGNMVDINNAGNYNSGVKVKMSKFWRFKTVKTK